MSSWTVKECPTCFGLNEECETCSGTGQIEEVNTSYDQNQSIGDEPQALYTELSNSEPIDAENGEDFLTVKKLQEDTKNENKKIESVWDKLDNMVVESYSKVEESLDVNLINRLVDEDMTNQEIYEYLIENDLIHLLTTRGEIESELYKIRTGEKLNKDGTGIARATRGIDPTKTPAQVLQFVYVSKSECDICKQYDGKHFGIDSPNRPVIPRLEEGDGVRPYTHPHCKCKWVRPFSKSGMKNFDQTRIGESNAKELGFKEEKEKLLDIVKSKYPNYDEMSEIEQRMAFIKSSMNELSESKAEEDILDPMPLASMAVQMFNAVQPTIASKVGKFNSRESESPYGIQKMLDMFVDKKLTKEEKQEIEVEHNLDFTLENLLRLVADKLTEKAGKKLGLESHKVKGNEACWDGYKQIGMKEKDGKQVPNCVPNSNEVSMANEWKMDILCDICGKTYEDHDNTHEFKFPEGWADEGIKDIFDDVMDGSIFMGKDKEEFKKLLNDGESVIDLDVTRMGMALSKNGFNVFDLTDEEIESKFKLESSLDSRIVDDYKKLSTEGGVGSGKKGHQKWMRGTYAESECPNCMIRTEKKDGKCTICGQ